MRRLVAVTGIAAGLLLGVVPRYVLPACEYEGHPRMHCSDTARAELVVGALLVVAGAFASAVKRPRPVMGAAAVSCALLALAWFMPDVYGYCASPRMPCHYGMVPGIRFIAVLAGVLLIAAIVLLAKGTRRNPEAS